MCCCCCFTPTHVTGNHSQQPPKCGNSEQRQRQQGWQLPLKRMLCHTPLHPAPLPLQVLNAVATCSHMQLRAAGLSPSHCGRCGRANDSGLSWQRKCAEAIKHRRDEERQGAAGGGLAEWELWVQLRRRLLLLHLPSCCTCLETVLGCLQEKTHKHNAKWGNSSSQTCSSCSCTLDAAVVFKCCNICNAQDAKYIYIVLVYSSSFSLAQFMCVCEMETAFAWAY